MANSWLRLWHEMPNDPKWRTIARISKQPIALVQAVYLHLLVSASRNVTRGHSSVTPEDLASHFDVTECDIEAVLTAMQGRVLEGGYLTGWDNRQPKREDAGNPETGAKSAAQRKREQRERAKQNAEKMNWSQQCHDESRGVTTDKDKDKDKDLKDPPLNPPKGKKVSEKFDPLSVELPGWLSAELWAEWVGFRKELKKPIKTLRGVTASIKSLDEYRLQGHSPESVINHCIANEYQGLYAPPQKGAQPNRDINHISEIDTKIPKGFRGWDGEQ